ncbi:MAG: MiaB/RimO family radical SAM methylthiotransferase [Actinomycetota bacterium]|nr:MiaB/RimO family radical SAM methylthiotransferase [Actinomycetota bacterium]
MDRGASPDSGDPRVRVFVRTLGCKVNQVESEQIAAQLLGVGCVLAAQDEAAVVIVNTCTVTGEADAKTRKAVRHALNSAAGPLVVVTGCLAAIDRAGLESLGERVVVESDKALVAERVWTHVGARGVAPRRPSGEAPFPRIGAGFHTRAMVKIEDGCDAFCAYCIVPHARGAPRSVSRADVLRECEALVDAGTREIVLTGVNLGRYCDSNTGLAALVEDVAATGVARLRLSSVEPLDLTDRLLGVLAGSSAICPHLHVPLQAGCDSTLAAMGRAYTTAAYTDRVSAAREAIPGLAITTDVIAGFPEESEVHAEETLAFCRAMGFAKMHVFRYSVRENTVAAAMGGQVDPSARTSRASALRELGDELHAAYARGRVGTVARVLVERVRDEAGDRIAEGTTEDYLKARVLSSARVGDILSVRVARTDGVAVIGEQCAEGS